VRKRRHSQPRGYRGRARDAFRASEFFKLVDRGLTVSDHSSTGPEHRQHASAMAATLPVSAEFGVSDRNKVVDKINRPHGCFLDPSLQPRVVQSRVADVEVTPFSARPIKSPSVAKCPGDEAGPERTIPICQKPEERCRGFPVQDPPIQSVLHDRLRVRREMFEISEANAVDAGRGTARPATPDEPGDIEQQ